jgi:hypothetical protein
VAHRSDVCGNIYRQSIMTVIWLGDETPVSKSAFEGTRNCIAVAADNFDNDVEKLAIIIKNDPSAQQSIVYLDIDIGM